MDYVKLGNFLKTARVKSGRKQKEIAALLGVTPQNVSSWELGKSKIDIDTFFRITAMYQVNIQEILLEASDEPLCAACPDTSESKDYTEQEQELLFVFCQLNKEGQEKLYDYAVDLVSSGRYKKPDELDLDSEKII